MEPGDLLIAMSRYIVKYGIGKIRRPLDAQADQWYCSCCNVRLDMSSLELDQEKDNIEHREGCIYLQAKAVIGLLPKE